MLADSTIIYDKCSHFDEDHVDLWKVFQQWYCNKEFCDASIICSDSVTVQAHKLILAGASSYFQAALVGPMMSKVGEDGISVTSLDYSSSVVNMFLDCIYQSHTAVIPNNIDVVEYASLCDFLNTPNMSLEGLRVAALQLSPQNCISELNRATSVETIMYPKWVEILCYYIIHNVFLDGMEFDDIQINELSRESLMCLIDSPLTRFSMPKLILQIMNLFKKLKDGDDDSHLSHQVFQKISFYTSIEFLMPDDYILHSSWILTFGKHYEELRKSHILQCDHSSDSHDIANISSKEVVVKLGRKKPNGTKVGFVFYPEDTKAVPDSDCTCDFSFSLFDRSLIAKYFIWRNSAYVVEYNEDIRKILLWKHQWREFTWEIVSDVDLLFPIPPTISLTEIPFSFLACLIQDTQVVMSFTGPFLQQVSFLIYIDFTKKTPSISLSDNHGFTVRMIVQEEGSGDLLFFNSPYSLIKCPALEDIAVRGQRRNVSHSKQGISFQSVLSFLGKTFHIYSQTGEEGIYIDEFNFNCLKWDEQVSKLSNNHTLKDAFVANENLFVTFTMSGHSGVIFIGKCCCKEIEPGKTEITLVEENILKVDLPKHEMGGRYLVCREDLFLFEDLKVDRFG